MVGTFLEPSCGRRCTPIHSIPYSVAQPLERGSNNYYSIIQGGIHFLGYIVKAERKRKTPNPATWTEHLVGKPLPDMERLSKKIGSLLEQVHRIELYSKPNTQAAQIQYVNFIILGLAQYYQPSICSHAYHAIDRRVNNAALAVWKKLFPKQYNQMQVPLKTLCNLPHRHEGYESKTFAVERFFIKDRDQKKKSDSRNRWMGSMMRVCCNLLHALFSLQTGL